MHVQEERLTPPAASGGREHLAIRTQLESMFGEARGAGDQRHPSTVGQAKQIRRVAGRTADAG